jgi:spectrin beta
VDDVGKYLQGVTSLMDRHNLLESQVNVLGGRVRNLNKRAQPHMKSLQPESQLLQKRLDNLNKDFNGVHAQCQNRKTALEQSHLYFQFVADCEEEEEWLKEKTAICKSADIGKDLTSCLSLIQKHATLEQEMSARYQRFEQVLNVGTHLVSSNHPAAAEVKAKMKTLTDKWAKLKDLAQKRKTRLDDAAESHQYYTDANEAESWIKEKLPLAQSDDYGKDEETAKNLLNRHIRLDGEISAFQSDMTRLDQQATMMTKAASVHKLTAEFDDRPVGGKDSSSDEEEETVEVPYEYEVEETVEREVIQEEPVEVKIPQVRASYAFKGQDGMAMDKGEVSTVSLTPTLTLTQP